jgi:hypothetical protein
MGFTQEGAKKYKHLIPENSNRAWDVWDEPQPQLPGVVIAFHLLFPTSELAVMPAQRKPDKWKGTIFIHAHDNYGHLSPDPAPAGKMIAVTLFITEGNQHVKFDPEPSVYLASFEIGNGRRAQLIAHGLPESDIQATISIGVCLALSQAKQAGKWPPPPQGYGYFLGRNPLGVRYLVGARLNR